MTNSHMQEMVWLEDAGMVFWMPEQTELCPADQQKLTDIVQRSHAVGVPVRYAFTGSLFTGQRYFPGPQRDWYFMPLQDDPLWGHRHGYPMPERVLMDLRRLQAAGIEFDGGLFPAHDAYKSSGSPQATLEMIAPPPSPKAQATSARLGGTATKFFRAATLPMLGLGAGLMAAGAVATAAVGAASMLALDPILFGAVRLVHPRTPKDPVPAAFVYISHWSWDE